MEYLGWKEKSCQGYNHRKYAEVFSEKEQMNKTSR